MTGHTTRYQQLTKNNKINLHISNGNITRGASEITLKKGKGNKSFLKKRVLYLMTRDKHSVIAMMMFVFTQSISMLLCKSLV